MQKALIFSLLTALFLTACNSTTARRLTVDEQLLTMGVMRGEGDQRIPHYRINGWSLLDDSSLVITAGVNDRYLVTLRRPCDALQGSFSIGFTTPTGGLDRFEDIVVRHPGFGRDVCPIEDIIELRPV